MFNITPVLDCNPYAGKEFVSLTLQLMRESVKDEFYKTELHDMNIDRLDPALQHAWLMNLVIILYKVNIFLFAPRFQFVFKW